MHLNKLHGICLAALMMLPAAFAEKTADELITPKTRIAIEKGLKYLASRQISRGRDQGAFGGSGYSGSVGIAGLAGLAFMGDGNTPGVGRYGKHVEDTTGFILRNTNASGYIAQPDNEVGNMYCHGFALLFLTQAAGMTLHKDIDEKITTCINMLVNSQNEAGGWRYRPVKSDADLSVTVCQIMALRAARDAGFHVPDHTRDKCIEYVRKSNAQNGSFSYTLGRGGGSFPLTGAGVVSLYSANIYDDPMITKGLEFLKNQRSGSSSHYYYYGNYYATQAFWHRGGKEWDEWYVYMRDALLAKQSGDGSWASSYGTEFATSMALVMLQMPQDHTPVFAR